MNFNLLHVDCCDWQLSPYLCVFVSQTGCHT